MADRDGHPRLPRNAVAVYGPSLLGGIGSGAVDPLLPLMALDLGATPGQAGLVVTLVLIGSLCASLPGSVLTARWSERTALVWAALFEAAAMVVMVAATSLAVLAAAAFARGCGGVVFNLARQTYLTEAAPAAMRARALSTLGGMSRVGMFLGPLIGAGLLVAGGRPAVFAMAVLALLAAAVLSWRLPELPQPGTPAGAAPAHIGDVVRAGVPFFRTLGLGIMLLTAVRMTRGVALPLWAEHLGVSEAATSLVVAVSWAVDTALFYPGGIIMDRFGRRAAAVPTTFGMALAFALLPLTTGFWSLLAVAGLIALGNGFGSGIIMTISADASPEVGRPQFLGACRFLADLGAVGGSGLFSALTGMVSLTAGVGSIAVTSAVAGVIFLTWLPRGRPAND